MPDIETLIVIGSVFLVAGIVKGVVGLGLPTISLGLLAAIIDLPTAMGLLLIPTFVTNLWQAISGGQVIRLLVRLWPFLVSATAAIWLGALGLAHINEVRASFMLGVLLVAYGAISLAGFQISIGPKMERRVGPAFGLVNGALTGMTGSFVVPGVFYLQALGLPRDRLVQAMGLLFTLSTIGLAFALYGNGFMTSQLNFISAIAVFPAIGGMVLGRQIRGYFSETGFRKLLFFSLVGLGIFIAMQAWQAARFFV